MFLRALTRHPKTSARSEFSGSTDENVFSFFTKLCRNGCVPQEPKGPLVKHGQVARHDAAQFLSMLAKETGANCSLSFTGRFYFYRRHNVSPHQRPQRVEVAH